MYAAFNNIADWIIGVLAVFLILFWLIPPFRERLVHLIVFLMEMRASTRHQRSIQFHGSSVRAARNREYMNRSSRPPTDRQLDYIDSLLEKRETEEWIEHYHPTTIEEASALIEDLLVVLIAMDITIATGQGKTIKFRYRKA